MFAWFSKELKLRKINSNFSLQWVGIRCSYLFILNKYEGLEHTYNLCTKEVNYSKAVWAT